MLQVNIEKIIPVTEARDMFNKIVDEVEGTDELYVLTKNGKPCAVVVGVNHLEKLTGESHLNMQTPPPAQIGGTSSANNNSDDNNSDLAVADSTAGSSSDDSNVALANEQTAAVAPGIQSPNEVAEPITALGNNNQSFLTEETVSVPTEEIINQVSEPLNATQSIDQIQPVPDDFSASIPTVEVTPDTTVSEVDGIGPIDTGATQFTTEDSASDIDPFASSGTIAENPEEDGLPPNNQNSQV